MIPSSAAKSIHESIQEDIPEISMKSGKSKNRPEGSSNKSKQGI
jgi:hypothetical protein